MFLELRSAYKYTSYTSQHPLPFSGISCSEEPTHFSPLVEGGFRTITVGSLQENWVHTRPF